MSDSEVTRELYLIALGLPESERPAFLERQCGDDPAMRSEVEDLLARHDDATGSSELDQDAVPTATASPDAARVRSTPASPVHGHIGSYRVIRELGRGGMGVVHLAVREDDRFRRTVALKVLKRGMDSDEILGRFELERQVLSALNHPNIARLVDGGATEDGQPFFALEYIEGEPIDEYCDSHRLRTKERLRLFVHVCHAVHYAHQNLIVHRDLKPGNILVTKNGDPKLLDFGIVKLLNPDLTAAGNPTGAAHLMTPEYASPEQVGGKPITTASDIYSLGVVLYRLLTGHAPYRLRSRSLTEMMQVVCDADPDRPSNAIATTEELLGRMRPDGTVEETRIITPDSISKTRGGRLDRLRRSLRGDIDNIVLMAMRKAPQRRYASAAKFAEDIERHLSGFPVAARPDDLSYRTSKFIKRNRTGVALVLLLLITSFAAVIAVGSAGVAREAEGKNAALEELAETVSEHNAHLTESVHDMTELVLGDVYIAIENLPSALEARETLAAGMVAILERSRDHAAGEREVLIEIARAYVKLGDIRGGLRNPNRGDLEAALEHYREAHEIRTQLAALEPEDEELQFQLAVSHQHVGDGLRRTREYDLAMAQYQEALRIGRALLDRTPNDPEGLRSVATSLQAIGDLHFTGQRFDEARRDYEESMTQREKLAILAPGASSLGRVARGYGRLARVDDTQGDRETAIRHLEHALAIRAQLAEDDPSNTSLQRDLALAHWQLAGMLDGVDAQDRLMSAAAIYEDLLNNSPQDARLPRDLTQVHSLLAASYAAEDQLDNALEHYEAALTTVEKLIAVSPTEESRARASVQAAEIHEALGAVCEADGRSAKAAIHYSRFLDIMGPICKTDPTQRGCERIALVRAALDALLDT